MNRVGWAPSIQKGKVAWKRVLAPDMRDTNLATRGATVGEYPPPRARILKAQTSLHQTTLNYSYTALSQRESGTALKTSSHPFQDKFCHVGSSVGTCMGRAESTTYEQVPGTWGVFAQL